MTKKESSHKIKRRMCYNELPYWNPNLVFPQNFDIFNTINEFNEKINYLEKKITDLERRIQNLENGKTNDYNNSKTAYDSFKNGYIV